MPTGTFVVDQAATFSTAVLMSTAPKERFGSPGVQDVSAEGVPKWAAMVAVTFTPNGSMAPVSDVLTVSVTQPANPADGMQLPAPVVFEGLRVGVNAPEKRDNGSIRGGRLWYAATGLRSSLMAGAGVRKGGE
jgi:hypothetical protein